MMTYYIDSSIKCLYVQGVEIPLQIKEWRGHIFSDQVENNSRVYITIETRESDAAHSAKFSILFDGYEHITIRYTSYTH